MLFHSRFIGLIVLAFACSAGAAAAENTISFANIPGDGNPSVKLAEGKNAPSVTAQETDDGWRFVTKGLPAQCSSGPATKEDSDFFDASGRPSKFGAFQLPDGKGVFMATVSEGSGAGDTVIMAFNPRKCAAIAMQMHFTHQVTDPLPEVMYSTNWNSPALSAERVFLASVAAQFGYLTEDDLLRRKSNPRYAWFWWKKENGNTDGKLSLHSYKGKPTGVGSAEAAVKSGNTTYTAWFKSGVTSYDSVKDEFRPLFHPKSMDSWPSALKLQDDYLIIGTRGEGLAIINLKTSELRRLKAGEEAASVQSISVKNGEIVVNKTVKFPLPKF
jgi:hypothetical protein